MQLIKKYKSKKNQWPITDCSSSDLYRHGSNSGGKRVRLNGMTICLKRLEPSEEQQETMQESNYIQNIDQSVTQNGVTVTLTDSIQDQGFLYAFF